MSRVQPLNRRPLRERAPIEPTVAAGTVRLRLIADDRPGVIERRRYDCRRLATCEVEWTQVHGSQQARCPLVCILYEREDRRPVDTSGSGGMVMGGVE